MSDPVPSWETLAAALELTTQDRDRLADRVEQLEHHVRDLVLRMAGLETEREELRSVLETLQRRLDSVAEMMTEHAYQELASALDMPARFEDSFEGCEGT